MKGEGRIVPSGSPVASAVTPGAQWISSMTTKTAATPFWTWPLPELLQQLDTSSEGLSSEEAHRRLIQFGRQPLATKEPPSRSGSFHVAV